MEKNELAIADITTISKLQSAGVKVPKTQEKYISNTVTNIAKLTTIQETIKKLQEAGTINPDQASSMVEHVKITESLVLKVGDHDEELKKQKEKIEELADIVNRLKKGQQLTAQELGAFNGQYTEKISEIESKMVQFVTKSEFKQLKKKVTNIETKDKLFGGKIKILERKVNDQDTQLISIDETLQQANCYKKQEVREAFAQLKVESVVLNEYAHNFHWSLSNYLLAYRSIGTELVVGQREKNKFEKIWDKVGEKVVSITEAIPVVGGIFGLIEEGIIAINDQYKEAKFERKMDKINSIITSAVLEEDLNLAVASSAVQIARIKEKEIISKSKEPEQHLMLTENERIIKEIKKFNNKVDDLLTKACKISKTEVTPAGKMAIKDVILFINYIVTHDGVIEVKNDGLGLDKVINEVFCNSIRNTDKAIVTAIEDKIKSISFSTSENGCTICVANEIIYDNELLNHPELLKELGKAYSLNRVLDLSKDLSRELVSEAGNNHDYELILGGLMSLSPDASI
jgi:hypothetical protein